VAHVFPGNPTLEAKLIKEGLFGEVALQTHPERVLPFIQDAQVRAYNPLPVVVEYVVGFKRSNPKRKGAAYPVFNLGTELSAGKGRDKTLTQGEGGLLVEDTQRFARAIPFRAVSHKELLKARFLGHFQGSGIAANRMPADSFQDEGVASGYAVQIASGRIPVEGGFSGPVLKILLVPSAAMDHRARLRGNAFQVGPPLFHQGVYRRNPPDIDLVYRGAEMPQMKVRIVETRQQEPSPSVYPFHRTQGRGQGGHLRFGSRSAYSISVNQNRLIKGFPIPVNRNMMKKGTHVFLR
jgi:hypothetical protein